MILARTNRVEEAARAYGAAVALKPKNVDYRCGLAQTLQRLGQTDAARKEYDEAIRIDPLWPQRVRRDAWVLAVHPDAKKRNGRHALQLAQRVCEAMKNPGAVDLDVLAAAQAESAQFDDAAATARQAAERASRDGLTNLLHRSKNAARFIKRASLSDPPARAACFQEMSETACKTVLNRKRWRVACGLARRSHPVRTHASSFVTTLPCTSVRRKSRPWNLCVSCVWSKPRRCRSVACRSWI